MKICSVRNRCLTGMKASLHYWWKWTLKGLIRYHTGAGADRSSVNPHRPWDPTVPEAKVSMAECLCSRSFGMPLMTYRRFQSGSVSANKAIDRALAVSLEGHQARRLVPSMVLIPSSVSTGRLFFALPIHAPTTQRVGERLRGECVHGHHRRNGVPGRVDSSRHARQRPT
jgi:hypothetical protein